MNDAGAIKRRLCKYLLPVLLVKNYISSWKKSWKKLAHKIIFFTPQTIFYFLYLTYIQTSGSQTFLVHGPLSIIWWSAKHKILICIRIHGPLQPISWTTSGLRSRLWESLIQTDMHCANGPQKTYYLRFCLFVVYSLLLKFVNRGKFTSHCSSVP